MSTSKFTFCPTLFMGMTIFCRGTTCRNSSFPALTFTHSESASGSIDTWPSWHVARPSGYRTAHLCTSTNHPTPSSTRDVFRRSRGTNRIRPVAKAERDGAVRGRRR
ncbi:hypothetical protein NL676_008105 [Syzygium grande]|nr:hypothetical protein NL676_008105 [Syzygium grande]